MWEELGWPEVEALLALWRDEPPPDVLLSVLAQFVGWKPQRPRVSDGQTVTGREERMKAADFAALFGVQSGGKAVIRA